MTKRLLYFASLGLALCLYSCTKRLDNDIRPINTPEITPDTPHKASPDSTNTEADEYVTLELAIDGNNALSEENDDLKSYFYVDNHTPKFSFGQDGTTVTARTEIIIRSEISGVSSLQNIYIDDNAQWVIANSGRRLNYNGKIRVLKSAIDGADKIFLIASTLSQDTENPRTFYSTPIQEITTNQTALAFDIPYIMKAEIELVGADKKILRAKGTETPLFRPLGEMACFSITNSTDQEVHFYGLGGSDLHPTKSITLNTSVAALDARSWTLDLSKSAIQNQAWSPAAAVSSLPVKIWVKNLKPSQPQSFTIAAGYTKYFAAWSPKFVATSAKPENIFTMVFSSNVSIVYPRLGVYLAGHAGLITWGADVAETRSVAIEAEGDGFTKQYIFF